MADALKKVQPGEKLVIPASTFNTFIDVANAFKAQGQNGGAGRSEERASYVLVKNSTDDDLDRFSILGISGVVITPEDNLSEFENRPALNCVTPAGNHCGRFVIIQEPCKAGALARAIVAGTSPVLVNVLDEGHRFADVTPGDATKLTSGPLGSAEILWKASGAGDQLAFVRFGGADAHLVNLHNTSTETAPRGGCAVVTGYDADNDHYDVTKPAYDNDELAVLVLNDIAANAVGIGIIHGKGEAVYDDLDPVAGDHLGSTSGSWFWSISNTGNLLVDGITDAGSCTARVRFRGRPWVVYSDGYAWVNTLTHAVDSRSKAAATLWDNGPAHLYNTEAWVHFPATKPKGFWRELMIGLNMNIFGIVWVQSAGTATLRVDVDWVTQAWSPATLSATALPATTAATHFLVDLSAYALPIVFPEEGQPDTRKAKGVYQPLPNSYSNTCPYQTLVEVTTAPPDVVYGIRVRFSVTTWSLGLVTGYRWQSGYFGKCAILRLQT